jgi:hypothetical protein
MNANRTTDSDALSTKQAISQLRKASVTILSLSSLSVIDLAQQYNASVILTNLSQRQIHPAFNSTELHIPVVNSPLSQSSMY